VSKAYGGTLAMAGEEVFLPALAGDGPLLISVRRVFAWELLSRVLRA